MTVSREETQAKLAALSEGTLAHTPSQDYTVGDRIEERAREMPERTFLRFEDRSFSYSDINREANRTAHAARALGLRLGDVAALMMENRPEFLTTWMGLAKLGVTTALVNSQVRGRALRHSLEAVQAKRLFVGGECLESLAELDEGEACAVSVCVEPSAAGGVDFDPAADFEAARAEADDSDPDRSVRDGLKAGDDLFLVFTSGTTGLPKAARLSHMRFLGVGDGMSRIAGYGPDDVIYCVLPLYHGAGGMVVVSSALSQGAGIVLRRRFSASAFWKDVRAYGVTACQYIGEICRYLLNRPAREDDLQHGMRVMMGAGLGPDIWREFQERFGVERILEGWSSTEANTSIINLDNRVGSCGRIPFRDFHNARLIRYDVADDSHLRNEDGFCIECEPGEVGEMIGMILNLPDSGAGRFEGYTDAESTEAKILRDVFAPGDAWYRSGDLLQRDEDDYYYFVDRIGDTFRWKSENVSTQEVAEALGGFPGLEIANVYGVRVPGMPGRAGMAALTMADRAAFDPVALYAYAEARLPPYAVPLFLRLVENADVTTTFKLRKVDLQSAGYGPEAAGDPLYVCDADARTYVELTSASLARLGIAPFESES